MTLTGPKGGIYNHRSQGVRFVTDWPGGGLSSMSLMTCFLLCCWTSLSSSCAFAKNGLPNLFVSRNYKTKDAEVQQSNKIRLPLSPHWLQGDMEEDARCGWQSESSVCARQITLPLEGSDSTPAAPDYDAVQPSSIGTHRWAVEGIELGFKFQHRTGKTAKSD